METITRELWAYLTDFLCKPAYRKVNIHSGNNSGQLSEFMGEKEVDPNPYTQNHGGKETAEAKEWISQRPLRQLRSNGRSVFYYALLQWRKVCRNKQKRCLGEQLVSGMKLLNCILICAWVPAGTKVVLTSQPISHSQVICGHSSKVVPGIGPFPGCSRCWVPSNAVILAPFRFSHLLNAFLHSACTAISGNAIHEFCALLFLTTFASKRWRYICGCSFPYI